MSEHGGDDVREQVDAIYRTESRHVLATLIRLLGGFELAEEALHDAFVQALAKWPHEGIPDNPRAWLVSTGRFKAIDTLRRRARFDASQGQIAEALAGAAYNDSYSNSYNDSHHDSHNSAHDDGAVGDDRLRLIFTCCHPALPPDAQIALTMREVCGLTTEEIARAFLTSPSTVAQRIVRAKSKIRDARIPYQVPEADDLPARLDSVLHVIYLMFTEGYAPSTGDALTRGAVSDEAIRLGRLLCELLPLAEAQGLLALMLLHESRRESRTDAHGDIILLEAQDRSRWDREMIAEGCALAQRALRSRQIGAYTVQAAIAAVHAETRTASETDWSEIVGLYDVLQRADSSPVVALNRAVAVAMRDGPHAGLALIDALLDAGELSDYHLVHASRAALCERAGNVEAARQSYERALALVRVEPERRHITRALQRLRDGGL